MRQMSAGTNGSRSLSRVGLVSCKWRERPSRFKGSVGRHRVHVCSVHRSRVVPVVKDGGDGPCGRLGREADMHPYWCCKIRPDVNLSVHVTRELGATTMIEGPKNV